MSTAPLRDLVAATALRLGPDAPTLCDPWTVRDLLAHLVVRESRPDALPGVLARLGPLARHTASLQDRVAGTGSLQDMADRVRRGPAPWWPTRLPALDRAVNTAELTVHLEDMVRAQPGWTPTPLEPQVQAALWSTLRRGGRMFYRSAPVGVVAVSAHGRVALRRPPAGVGTVVLRGTPLELLLHAFGRTSVARVEVEGDDGDVAALARHTRAA